MKSFNGVILDHDSLHPSDLDFSPLLGISAINWSSFSNSSPNNTAARIANADIVLTNKVALGEVEIAAAPKLKYIGILATGTNVIDHLAARQRGIIITNCKAYGTASVVQHTWALILALNTHLQAYNNAALNTWPSSPFFSILDHPITELEGKTLGVIGYGELGQSVAHIGRAFGMKIITAKIKGWHSAQHDTPRLDLPQFLAQSDIVSIHCPLSLQTGNLIDRAEFALMKPSARLINCARGGIVNETALAEALKKGHIAGAGVDVLTIEPPTKDHVLLDTAIPNLILTPHCAWGSQQARQRLIKQAADQLKTFIHKHTE